jgi:hypothetical protein
VRTGASRPRPLIVPSAVVEPRKVLSVAESVRRHPRGHGRKVKGASRLVRLDSDPRAPCFPARWVPKDAGAASTLERSRPFPASTQRGWPMAFHEPHIPDCFGQQILHEGPPLHGYVQLPMHAWHITRQVGISLHWLQDAANRLSNAARTRQLALVPALQVRPERNLSGFSHKDLSHRTLAPCGHQSGVTIPGLISGRKTSSGLPPHDPPVSTGPMGEGAVSPPRLDQPEHRSRTAPLACPHTRPCLLPKSR